MALRSPGQILSHGVQFRVVAQGQDDAPSLPVATGTYDLTRHALLLHPTTPASVLVPPGGYYTWDGSSLNSSAWGTVGNPYSTGVAWQIIRIENLGQPIQHATISFVPSSTTGWEEQNITVSAVPDYTRAIVFPKFSGSTTTSTTNGKIYSVNAFMTSNTNVRIRYYIDYGSGTFPSVTTPVIIIPTR